MAKTKLSPEEKEQVEKVNCLKALIKQKAREIVREKNPYMIASLGRQLEAFNTELAGVLK